MKKKWGIHIDTPWTGCKQEYGEPSRMYIKTPKFWVLIALWPGNQTQTYDWKTKKYTDKFSWIVFHPNDK